MRVVACIYADSVSTHSRPKAAGRCRPTLAAKLIFVSTHSRPKAAGRHGPMHHRHVRVSTHSRPKAAGRPPVDGQDGIGGFNTQPPEGGWIIAAVIGLVFWWFQHTAARRRLGCSFLALSFGNSVSTHSRPKAAGYGRYTAKPRRRVSTHSRPKAAGRVMFLVTWSSKVSTHSRPKAAGASLKSLAPSGFAAPISLSSQEKREREYNTAFSVTPAFAIS